MLRRVRWRILRGVDVPTQEIEVKKFMLLHYGFEKPTPEIMTAWGAWFESIAERTVDQGGFSAAREISASGTTDLPMGMESITGYNVIEAESLDEAERIAGENPYIAGIRVYEIRGM
jgi:hypothetical protein